MKKRNIQRWIKRVSCRVGALLSICLILATMVVPTFASNNAQWRKWIVAESRLMYNESGTQSTYFRLTPYQNGEVYPAYITSITRQIYLSTVLDSGSVAYNSTTGFVNCVNYPNWWRSAIPLGGLSYVQIEPTDIYYGPVPNPSSPTRSSSCQLRFFDIDNAIDLSIDVASGSSGGASASQSNYPGTLSQSSSSSPVFCVWSHTPSGVSASSSYVTVTKGQSTIIALSSLTNLRLGWTSQYGSGIQWDSAFLTNLSSDDLAISCHLNDGSYCTCVAKISFWVGVDKLPPGLQVGDEFPADTDAFDQLRDELLKQFPEASENIENGKSSIQGWNDTETVGSDVAESSLTVINGLFQNLGQFLAVVSLMIFGAVCLRMLIKKAVSG